MRNKLGAIQFGTILILMLLTLGLAACASPTTPPTEAQTEPTSAIVEQPTAGLPEPTSARVEPTAAPTAEMNQAAPAVGATTYKIVPEESSVTYEVGETFFNQNNRFAVAVGKTSQINGEIRVDQTNPQSSSIGPVEIDISQFRSDSSRRDGAIRGRFLESDRYPIATFTPTSVEGLPASYTPGQELSFTVTGDLKVKETIRPVTFDVTARLDNGALTGTATTTILMSDFSVGPIVLAGILGTEDQVKLTLEFVARR